MLAAVICREMKWTWQEYQDQPAFFVDALLSMLQAESKQLDKETKRP